MASAKAYREFAAQCNAMAADSKNSHIKSQLMAMARTWEMLAIQAEMAKPDDTSKNS
jgi:hypothetical protein